MTDRHVSTEGSLAEVVSEEVTDCTERFVACPSFVTAHCTGACDWMVTGITPALLELPPVVRTVSEQAVVCGILFAV